MFFFQKQNHDRDVMTLFLFYKKQIGFLFFVHTIGLGQKYFAVGVGRSADECDACAPCAYSWSVIMNVCERTLTRPRARAAARPAACICHVPRHPRAPALLTRPCTADRPLVVTARNSEADCMSALGISAPFGPSPTHCRRVPPPREAESAPRLCLGMLGIVGPDTAGRRQRAPALARVASG